ncbi:DsrE family protein [Draconibacterium sediminis]|uniref:DsrE family protein n=1 Tax=Draconibacterium sediminis TaxID=1544798 RepID=UPI0026ED3AB0|nr:DsrE family protein [Draconibacterium sediminis]
MKNQIVFILVAVFVITNSIKTMAQTEKDESVNNKLVVVWTSDDPYLAERMVLMYTHAAKKNDWFNEVTLIIWGPSAKMVSENLKMQEKLKAMQKDGVEIQACIACATAYGVVDELKNLNFEVKGMGKPLTDYLKSDAKVLTF